MELTSAGLKRAALSLQLLPCSGMQLCRAAGCSAELPVAEGPVPRRSCPGNSPGHSAFPWVGLLPVPGSAVSVGRAVPRGTSFPFTFCWQVHIKKMRGSRTLPFFLLLPGLQTSKLFEISFPRLWCEDPFPVLFHYSKTSVLWSGLVNSAAR